MPIPDPAPARRFALGLLAISLTTITASAAEPPGLKDLAGDKFRVGVGVSPRDIQDPKSAQLIERNFNSITYENAMKWRIVQPTEGNFDFREIDEITDFATARGIELIGHTFVWHHRMPAWVFKNADGSPADREVVLRRMRDHIRTVMERYRDRIHTWDVVNEVVSDKENEMLRPSPWIERLGPDFVAEAFRTAREVDPNAILLYNDYGIESGHKHRRMVTLLKEWLAAGVPIDGIGMQCHIGLEKPSAEDMEKAIRAFHDLGLKVSVTELDVSVRVRDFAKAGGTVCPPELLTEQGERYGSLFRMFARNADALDRVTIWNIHDGVSWLNDFPVKNRADFPVLWDREHEPKPAYHKVVEALSQPAS